MDKMGVVMIDRTIMHETNRLLRDIRAVLWAIWALLLVIGVTM